MVTMFYSDVERIISKFHPWSRLNAILQDSIIETGHNAGRYIVVKTDKGNVTIYDGAHNIYYFTLEGF